MTFENYTAPLIKAVSLFIGASALYIAFGWLLKRGGAPSEESGETIYSVRPVMRICSCAFLLFGIWLLWCAASPRQQPGMRPIELFFGAICAGGGAFVLSTKMILDEAGIHYIRWPNRRTSIPWDALDHYEVVVNTRQVTSTFYYLRPTQGDSIAVSDTVYNADDIMRRIQARQPLRQQPYKRRKWYGG